MRLYSVLSLAACSMAVTLKAHSAEGGDVVEGPDGIIYHTGLLPSSNDGDYETGFITPPDGSHFLSGLGDLVRKIREDMPDAKRKDRYLELVTHLDEDQELNEQEKEKALEGWEKLKTAY